MIATDHDLAIAIKAGDRHAADELVRRYLPLARRIVARAGVAEVEDVVQAGMLRFYRGIVGTFDPSRSVQAYAWRVFVNESRRWAGRNRRRRANVSTEEPARCDGATTLGDTLTDAHEVDADATVSEQSRMLRAMVAEMAPRRREAMMAAIAGEDVDDAGCELVRRSVEAMRKRVGMAETQRELWSVAGSR